SEVAGRGDRYQNRAVTRRRLKPVGKALGDFEIALIEEYRFFRVELPPEEVTQLLTECLLKLLHPGVAVVLTRVAQEKIVAATGDVSHRSDKDIPPLPWRASAFETTARSSFWEVQLTEECRRHDIR